MLRFIFYIIVTYVIFKVIGIVLQFVRQVIKFSQPAPKPAKRATTGTPPMPYTNVEDVDYEDITDKK
jgi:hypothetical protein